MAARAVAEQREMVVWQRLLERERERDGGD